MSKQESLPLDAALQYAQAWGLALCYSETGVELWSPHVRGVSIKVRRSLRKHQAAIVAMMRTADVRVCPASALHRKHHWQGGICLMCRKLDESLEPVISTTAC